MDPNRKPPKKSFLGLGAAYVDTGSAHVEDLTKELEEKASPYDRAVGKIAMHGWDGASLTKQEEVALITKTPTVHGARDEAAAYRMGGFKDCYVSSLNAISMERGPTRQQVRSLLRQLRKAHLAGIISL